MEKYFFLLLPITVTCAWELVFLRSNRVKQLHDRLFLAGIAGSALTYYILMHSLVDGTNSYHFVLLDNIETLIGLSICPLLFLYIRSVARDAKWHRWYAWLFAPAIVVFIAGTTLSFLVGWDTILARHIDGYHPFTPEKGNIMEWLYYIVKIQLFDITIEIMAVLLIAQCVFYIVRYSRKAEQYYANIEDASIDKIRRFLTASILNLIILFLLTFFILNIIGNNVIVLLVISLCVSILLWRMAKNAYGIVVAKDSLEIIDSLPEAGNEEIHTTENDQISKKLEHWLCSNEKQYCREGITLADIAREIKVSPRALSVYVNNNKRMNFRRWINTLRIAEAKRLISDNPVEKLTFIAVHCGFADLATFSKVFHMIEGCSPDEYRKSTHLPNHQKNRET